MSGPAPFGTMWRNGKLVPQPAEAPLLSELIEAYLATGGRMKATAASLNAKGLRTRRGGPWTDVAVTRVLGQEGLSDLVPESLWRRCEGLLAERSTQGRRSVHPLGSIIHCHPCGGRMYLRGEGPSGRFICQECRSKIPHQVLEQKFLESLGSVVLSSQEVICGVQDDPRAAEVARAIGSREVPVAEIWPALQPAERRQLVDVLVERIEVGKSQIRVVLAVPDRFQAEPDASQADSLTCSHDLRAPREGATRQQASRKQQVDGTASGSPSDVPWSEPKAYRIRQVARLLNVLKSTAYDLVRTGVLASVRVGNGRGVVLVPASAVTAFLEERKRRRYSHGKPSGQKGGGAWP